MFNTTLISVKDKKLITDTDFKVVFFKFKKSEEKI